MTDILPSRIVSMGRSQAEYYVHLQSAAWSIPTIDPFTNPDPNPFFGNVGRLGKTGFEPSHSNQLVAFLIGCCTGCFYREEVVPVIPWPFRRKIPGMDYKWLAVGTGTIAAWATKSGMGWEILPGTSIGGGPVPPHQIVEYDYSQGTIGIEDAFPGKLVPYSANPVTLTDKPAHFRWCGAEGYWYPVVQTPG